jgi:AcrR family transcriptional regulator
MEVFALRRDQPDCPVFSNDPKKQAILEAALHEFAEKGYSGASTRSIAKCAGIANGLIYYYFKDKKTLFLQLCRILREWVVTFIYDGIEISAIFETMLGLCKKKLELFSVYPAVYRVVMEEIRFFPKEFQADGKEIKRDISFWTKAAQREFTPHQAQTLEIMELALDAMGDRLLAKYFNGELTGDEMFKRGIQKAVEFIEYFKKVWDLPGS